jgi:hypothetical protein
MRHLNVTVLEARSWDEDDRGLFGRAPARPRASRKNFPPRAVFA